MVAYLFYNDDVGYSPILMFKIGYFCLKSVTLYTYFLKATATML